MHVFKNVEDGKYFCGFRGGIYPFTHYDDCFSSDINEAAQINDELDADRYADFLSGTGGWGGYPIESLLLKDEVAAKANATPDFVVGDEVRKRKGYQFPSRVVSVFSTSGAHIRIVAEMHATGILHIFRPEQLEKVTSYRATETPYQRGVAYELEPTDGGSQIDSGGVHSPQSNKAGD